MKKTILAVALLAFAGAANAGLWCKNSKGETYEWHIGQARPVDSANFKTSNDHPVFSTKDNVVCILNGALYRNVRDGVANINGFPTQDSVPDELTVDPNRGGQGGGTIYRGDAARWLIDNLPSSYGFYADQAYFNSINP